MSDPSRAEVPTQRPHVTVLRIPLFEVDLGQAVYHGNYFHLFEIARENYLRDLGYAYRRFMDQGLHLTIVETTCSYRRPLHYDELVEIHTSLSWWRTRSVGFVQSIYRCDSGKPNVLCTHATLNMVCVRFSGQPTRLPAEFVHLLQQASEAQTGILP